MITERRCETHGWIESMYWMLGRDKYLRCSICGDMLTDEVREVEE